LSQTPLIIRGDVLAIDVEKISLKPGTNEKVHKTVAETVAVENGDRELVFWGFVKWTEENVCQIFPMLTGFSRDKLQIGLDAQKYHVS